MKILRSLNGMNLSTINSTICEEDVDGFSLSVEYKKGTLINSTYWKIEQNLWKELEPSSKIFLLRIYNNGINLDEENIIYFFNSIMPLVKKYPSLILEHFSTEGLRKVKERLSKLSNPYQISIATKVNNYYSDGQIQELGVDYEMHNHLYIPFVVLRVKMDKKVIYSHCDRQNQRDAANLLYETECSDNLHIITNDPVFVKTMVSKCPKKI